MTALTVNRSLKMRNTGAMSRYSYIILTTKKVYKHAFMELTAAGKAQPCTNNTTATFIGIAEDEVATGNGTRRVTTIHDVEVRLEGAGQAVTALTAGMVNDTAIFAADDNLATNATTLGPQIGIITERVGANDVWIRLRSVINTKGV